MTDNTGSDKKFSLITILPIGITIDTPKGELQYVGSFMALIGPNVQVLISKFKVVNKHDLIGPDFLYYSEDMLELLKLDKVLDDDFQKPFSALDDFHKNYVIAYHQWQRGLLSEVSVVAYLKSGGGLHA